MIHDRVDKIHFYVTQFLRLNLLVTLALSIYNLRWALIFSVALIFFLTYLPHFFEKKYRIYLPVEFEFIIILFIYASLFLGEVHGYYTRFWWWDVILHTGSAMALGFAGFMILYVLYYREKIQAKPFWIAFFSFCFAVALGAVWEIFEFFMDQFFGLNMQKTGLVDTMWDLIVDSLGALITAFVGYFFIRGKKPPYFNRVLMNFVQENPQFFKK